MWTPSNASGFEGWTWKADASSDELCGHLLAFTVVSTFMNASAGPGSAGSAQEAAQFLVDIADYITSNGFYLIGNAMRLCGIGKAQVKETRGEPSLLCLCSLFMPPAIQTSLASRHLGVIGTSTLGLFPSNLRFI